MEHVSPSPPVESSPGGEAARAAGLQPFRGDLPSREASLGLGIGFSSGIAAMHDEPSPPVPPEVLKQRREAKPRRSILKKPAPPQSRFNFKRDILQPINSRFAYPDGQASSSTEQPAGFSWRNALSRWSGPTVAVDAPNRGPPSPVAESAQPASPVASTSAAPSSALLSVAPLKSVAFTMSTLAVVYPINATGQLPPADEAETRQRVEREFRKTILDRKRMPALSKGKAPAAGEGGWTGAQLERLYAECCRTREVFGLSAVRAALQDNLATPPRTLNLAHQQIGVDAALALSDLLSVDWGLRKLVLEDTSLDDESLKPLIHALLVSASLPTLSLANNKRIRARGWRLVAVLISRASRLAFLDLSDNNVDRRTVEWLIQAVMVNQSPAQPDGGITPSRAENRSSPKLDMDPSRSPLFDERLDAFLPKAPLLRQDSKHTRKGTLGSLKLDNCGLKNQALEALAHGIRVSGIKHISLRRNRISALGAVAIAVMMRDYTVAADPSASAPSSVNSSPVTKQSETFQTAPNGLSPTARASDSSAIENTGAEVDHRSPSPAYEEIEEDVAFGTERKTLLGEGWRPDDVRTRLQKQIDAMPRIGSLLTMDVKGNDIKGGVVYIAQVLKRNRTLRVLNLSDNKIEPQGLAAIAAALRHNSTLETLDMSKNPCSGPSLEGILALRAAFSHNRTLMRVFLNSTELSSQGAISLAEFLPDASALIHLDLTENFDVDIAGVMALAAAVKHNNSIRCLDLNIPLNDPDFARLSQEILQSCIRNTEAAQEMALAMGNKAVIAAPIHTSAVARNLEESKVNGMGRPRSASTVGTLLNAAQGTHDLLRDFVYAAEDRQRLGQAIGSEALHDVINEARVAKDQVDEALPAIKPTDRKDRLMVLRDDISALLDRAQRLFEGASDDGRDNRPVTPLRPSAVESVGMLSSSVPLTDVLPNKASPAFSITDSDDDSGAESDGSISTSSGPKPVQPMRIAVPPRIAVETQGWAALAKDLPSSRSPVDHHSRTLTLEEGEVFRRKVILDAQADSSGSEDEDDGTHERDVSGEELRKEILEADVPIPDKPSPRHIPISPPLKAREDERLDEALLNDPL